MVFLQSQHQRKCSGAEDLSRSKVHAIVHLEVEAAGEGTCRRRTNAGVRQGGATSRSSSPELTTVDKQQPSTLYVSLGEVQNVPGRGALQGQVAVARGRDDKLQQLRRSVRVFSA